MKVVLKTTPSMAKESSLIARNGAEETSIAEACLEVEDSGGPFETTMVAIERIIA
jgi:hypothetical protein